MEWRDRNVKSKVRVRARTFNVNIPSFQNLTGIVRYDMFELWNWCDWNLAFALVSAKRIYAQVLGQGCQFNGKDADANETVVLISEKRVSLMEKMRMLIETTVVC